MTLNVCWRDALGWASRLQRKGGLQLKLLLLFTLIVMVGFAFPRLIWTTHVGYTLIALTLTQLMVGDSFAPVWADRLYRGLGILAVVSMWLWLLTPHELIYSGVPLALSWSVLVGWSVIRLVKRFAQEPKVSEALLMGATAGYLHIGLTAGLVMSALETIQPGSFGPLNVPIGAGTSVFATSHVFSTINYFAFVCLTTVGFGDINPMLPLSRMVSVATSIAGPLYLAAVMGVLIGRFASNLERTIVESDQRPKE
tara:strand:+ start:187 stop:948 length:762 start_codon:yes stop_codon:yes gene_type:complete